jgi:CHAT domain-containing protein
LHGLLWAPIEKDLPAGTNTVILSPDGELNFLSFATLLSADDEFLIEKYSIRYVASGRDLLREHEVSPTELLAVFGNPDFGSQTELVVQQTETSSPLAIGASEMRDFANMSLSALPGTDAECVGLKAQAEASGKPIEVFLGIDATEAQLKGINSPRILHLATHGFFLPETNDERRREEGAPGTDGMNLLRRCVQKPKDPCDTEEPDASQRLGTRWSPAHLGSLGQGASAAH